MADWLADQPGVSRVYYPGFCDPRGLVGRQMRGPGAMIAFAPRGGYAAAAAVAQACRVVTHAVSLGGVDPSSSTRPR